MIDDEFTDITGSLHPSCWEAPPVEEIVIDRIRPQGSPTLFVILDIDDTLVCKDKIAGSQPERSPSKFEIVEHPYAEDQARLRGFDITLRKPSRRSARRRSPTPAPAVVEILADDRSAFEGFSRCATRRHRAQRRSSRGFSST